MVARFLRLGPADPPAISGYTLQYRLGTGGMGSVYLSYTREGLPVAIKIIKPELAENEEFRRRFSREVGAAQRVRGPFTTPVIAADPDGPVPWLATGYVAGPSVAAAVAEYGPFPVPAVLHLLAGTAQGIAAVHAAGLIHRDLKPANVLVAADGPKVIDFGIAHAADSSTTLTSTGQSIGTPAFMAPEQVRTSQATEATDVWALGHLALFAATGHSAFGDGNQTALLYRILEEPPNLERCDPALMPIIERCLNKDPGSRPSVDEVLAAANDALAGQTGTVTVGSWLPRQVAEAVAGYAAPPPPGPGPVSVPPGPVPVPVPPPWPGGVSVPPPGPGGVSVPGTMSVPPPGPGPVSMPPPVAGQHPGPGGPYGPPSHPGPLSGPYPTPPPTPFAQPPLPPTYPPHLGPAPAPHGAPPRRKSRPLAIIGALAVVVVALVAYTISQSGGSSGSGATGNNGPATSPQADASGKTATAASSGGSSQGSYQLKYSNAKFTLPGGGCTNGDVVQPSWVTFTGTGPQVSTGSGVQVPFSAGGDIDLDCVLGDGNGNPGIDFDGAQAAAKVSGSASPGSCVQAINTDPVEGRIQFNTLSPGEQFCIKAASGLLVHVTLGSVNNTSYDLSWTATAWEPPSGS